MTLEPTWFERTFSGKYFPEKRELIGSCSNWIWSTGERAGYLWRYWAHCAWSKHINSMEIPNSGKRCTYRQKNK